MENENTFQKVEMGVTGYFPYIKKCGYVPKRVTPKASDSFVVDTKLFMYKKASGIASDDPDIALSIANTIDNMFKHFPNTLLLNDGNEEITPMKAATLQGRKRKREESQEIADAQSEKLKSETDPETIKLLEEDIEKRARVARGVSTDLSKEVLRILREDRGYRTLQCKGEADPVLVQLAPFFTFVVSEDSDLLIAGIENLLRGLGTANELYSATDILNQINVFHLQESKVVKKSKKCKPVFYETVLQSHLHEAACLMGCDYTEGLKSVGLKTAVDLMMEHKCNCEHVVAAVSKDPEKYGTHENLLEITKAGAALFRPRPLESFDLSTYTNSEEFYLKCK